MAVKRPIGSTSILRKAIAEKALVFATEASGSPMASRLQHAYPNVKRAITKKQCHHRLEHSPTSILLFPILPLLIPPIQRPRLLLAHAPHQQVRINPPRQHFKHLIMRMFPRRNTEDVIDLLESLTRGLGHEDEDEDPGEGAETCEET